MSKHAHTSGDRWCVMQTVRPGVRIGQEAFFVASRRSDEAEANARLIAAAPALLEALQDLTLNVNEAMRTGGWVPTPLHASFWAAMSDSLAAIATATQAGDNDATNEL